MKFKLDLAPAIEKINAMKAKRVMLQLPEGLKHHALEYVPELEEQTHAVVFLSADPCFGACDLADHKAKALGCELLVHVGHSQMYEPALPTIFLLGTWVFDPAPLLEKTLELMKQQGIKSTSIATTAQYKEYLPKIHEFLQKNGIESVIGEPTERTSFEGQVLGCSFGSVLKTVKGVESILYFGDGLFHPLGMALSFKKPVVFADTISMAARMIDKEKKAYLKKRWVAISMARNSERFGVIVALKEGQFRPQLAEQLKKKIEDSGKKAMIVQLDHASPSVLGGMLGKKGNEFEVLVFTSCPRIPIDDQEGYPIPVLTAPELEMALRKDDLGNYYFDQMNQARYAKIGH